MSRLILAGIVALSMVGCALSQRITDPSMVAQCGDRPEQDQADNAANAYAEQFGFKDPESVQIRNVRIDGPTRWNSIHGSLVGWQVSFEVNAKNSFGAYVGFQRREVMILPDGSFRWRSVAPLNY